MHVNDTAIDLGDPQLQVYSEAGAKPGEIGLYSHKGTFGSGDDMGAISFWGRQDSGVTTPVQSAEILVEGDGTWANNDYPSRMTFHTTADGASSQSERLRIDSSGNLSLGTTTSIQKFTIDGGGVSIDNGWNVQWGVNASRAYVQGEDATGNNRLIFGTNNTQRLRIDSDGLKFGSDTAAANALDDYEQGTWTPKMYANGVDTGVTYGSNHGVYTKIGNLIHLRGQINLTDKGNGTSGHAIAIGNFPYTVANMVNNTSNDGTGWITYWYDFQDQFSWLSMWVQESTTYAYIKGVSGTSTDSNSSLNIGNIKDSSEFRFAVTYHVA